MKVECECEIVVEHVALMDLVEERQGNTEAEI